MSRSYLIIFGFLLLLSCKGEESKGGVDLNPDDTLAGYELNNERINAVEFNNQLTLMQEDAVRQITILFQSDSATVDQNYENVLFELEIYQSELKELEFDTSASAYKRSMHDLLSFYQTELRGEFKELIPLLKETNPSDEVLDRLDAYDRKFADQERAVFDSVFAAQEAFAKANNIKLQEL